MLLRKLTLDNFKSHVHSVAEFAPGANAICGKNYAGKTTLVQAIGLALFDCSPGTQSHFIRDGASAATLTVDVVSALDERVYLVTRRIGSGASWQVRDPKTAEAVVSGTRDVVDWLRDHLGVGRETDLSALFDDAVGVPQGELTAAFTQVKSNRKPRFDRLLGLEEYGNAYDNLRVSKTHIEDLIGTADVTIAGLEGKTRDLPGRQAAREAVGSELAALEAEQEALDEECRSLEADKRAGEEAAARLERIKSCVSRLEGRQALRAERLKAAQARLDEAEKAAAEAARSAAGQGRYAAAAAEAARLQSLVRQRVPLLAERMTWQTHRSVAESELETLKSRLAEAEKAERETARLAPDVRRQEEGEAAVDAAKSAVSDAKANLKTVQDGQRDSGDGLCPFFRERCRNAEATGRTLPQFFDARLTVLQQEVSTANAALTAAKQALAALGNPRRQYDLAHAQADGRPALEAAMRFKNQKVADCLGPLAEIEGRLLPFAGVDADMTECAGVMAETLAEADAYKLALPLSMQVPNRRAERERASAALRRVADALCRRQARRDEAAEAFDAEAYHAAVASLSEARQEYAHNVGLIEAAARHRSELDAEIARLLQEVEDLADARQERARLGALLEHLASVRSAIRAAGPQVTARLVARISQDAERLFRALIGDPSLGMRWTEDYEVLLRENGVERGLSPAAGSERVAAAIALRLAILQHLGGVRFAFFDEPTVHLDEERRDSLVARLMSLPFFTQLFVISHDDAFERATDHVVHVEKRDGRSVIRAA